jgi:DNA/RNA-binding domain of Phe-tRNA-synthetase-like protein
MKNKTPQFDIAPEVEALGLKGSYLLIQNLKNRAADSEFESLLEEAIQDLLAELTPAKIENDEVLKGFRLLHDAVGRSNSKNVASPESLLHFLLEKRSLPRINLLVDIYNLISVKTHLALGAHDINAIEGDVHLKMTTGTEKFLPLGYAKAKGIGPGEYGYIDDANDVICRLETRQVEKTKVTLETTGCFYIVQGNANTNEELLSNATDELVELTTRFCGGEVTILCPAP